MNSRFDCIVNTSPFIPTFVSDNYFIVFSLSNFKKQQNRSVKGKIVIENVILRKM